MRKETDQHVVLLLEGVMNEAGFPTKDVYGGLAGTDSGQVIVPQLVFRRSGMRTVESLDHGPETTAIAYDIHIVGKTYQEVGDIEDALMIALDTDGSVRDIENGIDNDDIEGVYQQRVVSLIVDLMD